MHTGGKQRVACGLLAGMSNPNGFLKQNCLVVSRHDILHETRTSQVGTLSLILTRGAHDFLLQQPPPLVRYHPSLVMKPSCRTYLLSQTHRLILCLCQLQGAGSDVHCCVPQQCCHSACGLMRTTRPIALITLVMTAYVT